MRITPRLWGFGLGIALLVSAAACGGSKKPNSDLPQPYGAYCDLMENRCVRCHDTERLRSYRAPTPQAWEFLVLRMKHHRGSGISTPDANKIVECLVYRDFGADGLKALRGETSDESTAQ